MLCVGEAARERFQYSRSTSHPVHHHGILLEALFFFFVVFVVMFEDAAARACVIDCACASSGRRTGELLGVQSRQ
jgi:hypothetical protein